MLIIDNIEILSRILRMDIYDTWKVYKDKMEQELVKFNHANKEYDFVAMKGAKD